MGHRLDVSVKRIVQQSKRTAAELQFHVDESTLLQAENKSLQEERKSLMQVSFHPYHKVAGFILRRLPMGSFSSAPVLQALSI
jgi:hypothetical protein